MSGDELRMEYVVSHQIVNVDDDGTPRCGHGDRMAEVAPGQWQCPDYIVLAEHLSRQIERVLAELG
jgi:ribosomal protein S27AE